MNNARINADGPLREEGLTRKIIGAFFEVYNELGHGFVESVYQRALAIELNRRGVLAELEAPIDVWYKGVRVGAFRADVLADRTVVVENKVSQRLTRADEKQLLNNLRGSALEIGLLLHFGPMPSFKRLICSHEMRKHRRPERREEREKP